MKRRESGYETGLIFAFLDATGVRGDDGRFRFINELRVNDSHKEMLERWERWEQVPLSKLDPLLMQYELMLCEYEYWAHATHGRDGFLDPFAEPKELVG